MEDAQCLFGLDFGMVPTAAFLLLALLMGVEVGHSSRLAAENLNGARY
eukprot:SAG11_NODE_35960_length_264_cov_0.624242_1_plen_47_part_10